MLKIPTGGKGVGCICIWNTSCVTFQRDWSGCYKCVGELPEGSLSWHVLVNLIEMPSATLGTAGRADLYRCRSRPRLITLADFDPWKGWAVEDGGVGVKVTCFVKLLLEDHGDSSAPHLHELWQLCVAAQRVRRRTAIRSRLCNWHQPDVGGYTCLERGGGRDIDVPGSLSFMVSDRRRQILPLSFTWESQLAAILKQKTTLWENSIASFWVPLCYS